MPGLVNAHTHLELSYLREHMSPGSSFVEWIRAVIAARREHPDPRSPEILASVERGIADSIGAGTAIVGDVSNTLVTFSALARSPLAAVVFYELIGFRVPDPAALVAGATQRSRRLSPTERVRASLAAHAPYSVAPLVLRAIRHALDRDPFAPCSVHLSESAEEIEFIRSAGGPWRAMLEELDVWDPAWTPPGVSPVQYLDDSGFLERTGPGGPRRAHDAGRPRAPLGARDHARHLSAQQRVHRRRTAADRGVLRLRCSVWRSAPIASPVLPISTCLPSWRPCAGSRPVCRHPCCSTAPPVKARVRSVSTVSTARSSQASARPSWRSTLGPRSRMWKNTWCPEYTLNRYGGLNEMQNANC